MGTSLRCALTVSFLHYVHLVFGGVFFFLSPRAIIAACAWNLPSTTCLIIRLFFHALIQQEAELSFSRADQCPFLSFIYA